MKTRQKNFFLGDQKAHVEANSDISQPFINVKWIVIA